MNPLRYAVKYSRYPLVLLHAKGNRELLDYAAIDNGKVKPCRSVKQHSIKQAHFNKNKLSNK
ncbi:MAG: hypothetical protein BGP13_02045 [Sphingobacteriales bacterium 40-81]|nr:MAG: hypothetical protein BGP13_02045 [Sphingobacteriales bacterium 40-81]